MHISDFDYELPEDLIAQHPLVRRDASRMLVVDRQTETWKDSEFTALSNYLRPEDVLVLNNTQVFPARLKGARTSSGGAIEVLLLREVGPNIWEALAKPARRLKEGTQILFGRSQFAAKVTAVLSEGRRLISFDSDEDLIRIIEDVGEPPLPPYIKRDTGSLDQDRERYQTIYAKARGAIAAPTAGLHFTDEVFESLRASGVAIAEITLHVGYGTFEPVRVDDTRHHRVASEQFSVSEEAADMINQRRAAGGRVAAVGTTTTRALESSVTSEGRIRSSGLRETTVTIIPGHTFRAVDVLLTNFHLPRSSLLMLVSAFATRDLILAAYRHAIHERYRFYSYGDCMLIF